MYPISKYKFFTNPKTNEIIAVSTFADKVVKGKAKCHENDTFDITVGQKLAALRCAQKIAVKRCARAEACVKRAEEEIDRAMKKYNQMLKYLDDSEDELGNIEYDLVTFEHSI